MTDDNLAIIDESGALPAALAPVGQQMNVSQVESRYEMLVHFKDKVLIEGVDYGKIPGTGDRPTLLQPGAQKLCVLLGVNPVFEIVDRVEDWTGEQHGGEPFFHYLIKCRLLTSGGVQVSESHGEINSWETKYRWRWVKQGQLPPGADLSALIKNKYGKYRIPNDGIHGQVNTLVKMGQKRSLVGATLGLGAAQFFTQDVEDFYKDITDKNSRATPTAPQLHWSKTERYSAYESWANTEHGLTPGEARDALGKNTELVSLAEAKELAFSKSLDNATERKRAVESTDQDNNEVTADESAQPPAQPEKDPALDRLAQVAADLGGIDTEKAVQTASAVNNALGNSSAADGVADSVHPAKRPKLVAAMNAEFIGAKPGSIVMGLNRDIDDGSITIEMTTVQILEHYAVDKKHHPK